MDNKRGRDLPLRDSAVDGTYPTPSDSASDADSQHEQQNGLKEGLQEKSHRVDDRGESVTSRDGLLDDAYGSKQRRLYSVQFGDAPSLSEDVLGFVKNRKKAVKTEISGYGVYDWLGLFLPILRWLPSYNWRRNLLTDIIAGLSVGAMLVPQGMSYANLAGLPSVYGLYGAFVPVLVYSVLGSSRQLAVGPVAVTSLLLGSGLADTTSVEQQANPNKPKDPEAQQVYNRAAIEVAMLAGAIYTAVGVFRLGWLTNFLSHSVIAGFMTGASIIIGLSQVKYILGITVPRHDPVHEQLRDIFSNIDDFQWRVFLMGISWLFILFLFKFLSQRYRRLLFLRSIGPITVTILGIAIVNIWHLQKPPAKIPVIGKIPKGLPHFTVGWWSPIENFGKKLGLAIVICVIDVLESVSIAKALAMTNKYRLNPTQELVGLGLANLAGAMFNCYTTTGSFSRSAVNNLSGAKSQLAGTVTGLFIMLVLLLLTPVFTNLPQSVQGAVVIAGVSSLFNYEEWWFLWKINKFDWIVFNVAFFCVMFLGVEKGLAAAIGLSIVLVLWKVAFPKTAVLGRLPGTTVYRNVKQYAEARQEDEILMVRIDAPLFFANILPIKDALEKYEERAEEVAAASGRKLRFLILDLSPVTDIDASAVHFLKDLLFEHEEKGLRLMLANPSRVVVHQIERAGLDLLIGREFIHVRMHEAVTYCKELMAEGQGGDTMHPTASLKRALSRASGEPHVGGVLGQGVLGLNQASQNQLQDEKKHQESEIPLGSIDEMSVAAPPAPQPSALQRAWGAIFRSRR